MVNLLEVRGITKRFGELVAVDDLSFHLKDGEFLGLMGPNGSGKTTTFNLLMGSYRQDTGEILLKGEEISWSLPGTESEKKSL